MDIDVKIKYFRSSVYRNEKKGDRQFPQVHQLIPRCSDFCMVDFKLYLITVLSKSVRFKT